MVLEEAVCCRTNYPGWHSAPEASLQLPSDHPGLQGNEQRVIIFTRPGPAGQGGNNKHQAVEIEFISPCSEFVNCSHHLSVAHNLSVRARLPSQDPFWECLIWENFSPPTLSSISIYTCIHVWMNLIFFS